MEYLLRIIVLKYYIYIFFFFFFYRNATTHGQSPFQGGGTHTGIKLIKTYTHTHLAHSPQVGADGSLEEWKIKCRRKNRRWKRIPQYRGGWKEGGTTTS